MPRWVPVCAAAVVLAAPAAAYIEPILVSSPATCAPQEDEAASGCRAEQYCREVTVEGADADETAAEFPNGLGLCFHRGAFGENTNDLTIAFVVIASVAGAATAGCGGGAVALPLIMFAGGFMFEEAVPLARAGVAGGAIGRAALGGLLARHHLNVAIPVLALPPLLMGYTFAQFLQPIIPAGIVLLLAIPAYLAAAVAMWHAVSRARSTLSAKVLPLPASATPTDEGYPAAPVKPADADRGTSTSTLVIFTAVFWVLATVFITGMRNTQLCGGAYAGWTITFYLVTSFFVGLGHVLVSWDADEMDGDVSPGGVQSRALVLGLLTGAFGVGAGEWGVLMLLQMGVRNETAGLTAASFIAWLGTLEMIEEAWFTGGTPYLSGGRLVWCLFAGAVAGMTMAVILHKLAKAKGRYAGPVMRWGSLAFTFTAFVLLCVVYGVHGDKAFWPPLSPCTVLENAASTRNNKEEASRQLTDLGLGAASTSLVDGLSSGSGPPVNNTRQSGAGASGFTANATFLEREGTVVDVVQVGTRTTLQVHLVGNVSDPNAAAAGANDSFSLGELLPGLDAEASALFQFPAAELEVTADSAGTTDAEFVQGETVEHALYKIRRARRTTALDPVVASLLAVLGDANVAAALNPTLTRAVEALQNPRLDAALKVLSTNNAPSADVVAALAEVHSPAISAALEELRQLVPNDVVEPRVKTALDTLRTTGVRRAIGAFSNATIKGAWEVLADEAVLGGLDPDVQGALTVLNDPRLLSAVDTLRSPSFEAAAAVLAEVDFDGMPSRYRDAIDVVSTPEVTAALTAISTPGLVGNADARVAVSVLKDRGVGRIIELLRDPAIEGAMDAILDEAVLSHLRKAGGATGERVANALVNLGRAPVLALQTLRNPSLGVAIDRLARVSARLSTELRGALDVVRSGTVREALARLTDASSYGAVGHRVRGAMDVIAADRIAATRTALKASGVGEALAALTSPGIAPDLPPHARDAVVRLNKLRVNDAFAALCSNRTTLEPDVVKALWVVKSDAFAGAVVLLTNGTAVNGSSSSNSSAATTYTQVQVAAPVARALRERQAARRQARAMQQETPTAAAANTTASGTAANATISEGGGVVTETMVTETPTRAPTPAPGATPTATGMDLTDPWDTTYTVVNGTWDENVTITGGVAEELLDAAVGVLADPEFTRLVGVLRTADVVRALNILTSPSVSEAFDATLQSAVETVRLLKVRRALATLQDRSHSAPADAIDARGALGVFRSAGVRAMLAVVTDARITAGVKDVRIVAALASIKDAAVVGAMDSNVRYALRALQDAKFAGVLDDLRDTAFSVDAAVPATAPLVAAVRVMTSAKVARAVSMLGQPSLRAAVKLFTEESVGVNPTVFRALEALRAPAVDAALRTLEDSGFYTTFDPAVRGALGVLRNPTVRELLETLSDPDVTSFWNPRVQDALFRLSGAAGLGGTDTAVRAALDALRNPSIVEVFDVFASVNATGDSPIDASVRVLQDRSLRDAVRVFAGGAVTAALDTLATPQLQGALTLAEDASLKNALQQLQRITPDTVYDTAIAAALKTVPTKLKPLAGAFSGVLSTAAPQLQIFADFLQMPYGLSLSGAIDVPDGVSINITKALFTKGMDAFALKTVAPTSIALGLGVSVEDAEFHVRTKRDSSTLADDGDDGSASAPWDVAYEVTGVFALDVGGVELRLPCTVTSAQRQLLLLVEEASGVLPVGDLQVHLANVRVRGAVGAGERSMDVTAELLVGDIPMQLEGAVLAESGDYYLLQNDIEGATLGSVLAIIARVLGLEMDAFDFIAPEWRTGVLFRSLSMAFASADVAVEVAGDEVEIPEGFSFNAMISVLGIDAELEGTVTSDGMTLRGKSTSFLPAILGPFANKVTRTPSAALSVTWGATRDIVFSIGDAVVLYGIDFDLTVAFARVDGASLSVLCYAEAQPEPGAFALSDVFKVLRGTPADTITFDALKFLYATRSYALGFPSVPALAGSAIEAGFTLHADVHVFTILGDLLGTDFPHLELKAVLPYGGKPARAEIALPEDASLELGSNLRVAPPTIRFALDAEPGVGLATTIEVGVAGEALAFDVVLMMGVDGATAAGTMRGFWEGPLGLEGLRLGEEVYLEVTIDYARYAVTGLPSAVALRGMLDLGNMRGELATRVSENPLENVAYGRIYPVARDGNTTDTGDPDAAITPADVIGGFAGLLQLDLPVRRIPSFFHLYNLEVFMANSFGEVAGFEYEPGLTAHADLVLLNGPRVTATLVIKFGGYKVGALIEPFALGPLRIRGRQSTNLHAAIEVSQFQQAAEVEGEIELFGLSVGAKFVIRGWANAEFEASMDFGPLLEFTCQGRSFGTGDVVTGYALRASLRSDVLNWLTDYIFDEVFKLFKLLDGIDDTLEEAAKKYRALYEPAYTALQDAKAGVAAMRARLRQNVDAANELFFDNVARARRGIEAAAAEWANRVREQKQIIDNAHALLEPKIRAAEDLVEEARAGYQRLRKRLTKAFEAARESFESQTRSARQKVSKAKDAADKAGDSASYHQRKLKGCSWWNLACSASHSAQYLFYKGKQAALWTAYQTAKAALDGIDTAARLVLNSAEDALLEIGDSAEKVALDGALLALDRLVREGVKGLVATAKRTLDVLGAVVEKYGPHQLAVEALKIAEVEGKRAIAAAIAQLDRIAESAETLALKSAEAALKAVEEGTTAVAFRTLQLGLRGGKALGDQFMSLGRHALRVNGMELEATLGGPNGGSTGFTAVLDVEVLGERTTAVLPFVPGDAALFQTFASTLRKKAALEMDRVFLEREGANANATAGGA